MADFLLVHGAWHTSSCWDLVASQLETSGHRVVALDLPGRPGDTTNRGDISVQSHVDAITGAARELSNPIVVAHSLSGFWASQAVERFDVKLDWLVFLCAYVPINGKSAADVAPRDTDGEIHRVIIIDSDHGTSTLSPESNTKEMLYGDCEPFIGNAAFTQLCPEPVRPALEPITVTESRFHSQRKAYIECQRDRVISIDFQRKMQTHSTFDKVIAMDTGHSPFLSSPAELTSHLSGLSVD